MRKEKFCAAGGKVAFQRHSGNYIPLPQILIIAIQEINKEYQRQETNQHSRMGGSARKPQQYHAEAGAII